MTIPKQKGIQKAVIYISTQREKGYKKCGTIKGLTKSKSFMIRKYGKSSLKRYASYYVKIDYYANGKKTSKSEVSTGNSGSLWYR